MLTELILSSNISLIFNILLKLLLDLYDSNIPHTIVVSVFSFSVCLISFSFKEKLFLANQFFSFLLKLTEINPKLLIDVFVPPLLFFTSFGTDFHIVRHEKLKIFLLVVPGVVLNTIILGSLIYPLYREKPISATLVYAAVLSPTDPTSVLAVVENVTSLKVVSELIKSESLLVDTFVVVLVELVRKLRDNNEVWKDRFFLLTEILFAKLVAPVLLSYSFAILVAPFLRLLERQPQLASPFYLASSYLVYFTSEKVLLASGGLSTVFFAIFLVESKSCPQTSLVFLYETIFFAFTSAYVFVFAVSNADTFGSTFLWNTLLVFLVSNLVRLVTVVVTSPLLMFTGYFISWKQLSILGACGVRGVISIALGFYYFAESGDAYREFLVSFYFIFLFSLLINTGLAAMLVKVLGLDLSSPTEDYMRVRAQLALEHERNSELLQLRMNPALQKADWRRVDKLILRFQRPKRHAVVLAYKSPKGRRSYQTFIAKEVSRVSALLNCFKTVPSIGEVDSAETEVNTKQLFFRLVKVETESLKEFPVTTREYIFKIVQFAEDKNKPELLETMLLKKSKLGLVSKSCCFYWFNRLFPFYLKRKIWRLLEELLFVSLLFENTLAELRKFKLNQLDNEVYADLLKVSQNVKTNRVNLEQSYAVITEDFYTTFAVRKVLLRLKIALKGFQEAGLLQIEEAKAIKKKLKRNLTRVSF